MACALRVLGVKRTTTLAFLLTVLALNSLALESEIIEDVKGKADNAVFSNQAALHEKGNWNLEDL